MKTSFMIFLTISAATMAMACDEQFLNELKTIARSEEVLFESHSKQVLSRSGLPIESNYEIFYSGVDDTFRHFSTIENIRSIQESSTLIAGHKTSNLMDGFQSINYKDISGVFMTHTEYQTEMAYIDFKLPVGTPVLHLKEMGAKEYVVLGERTWMPWFIAEVENDPAKYKSFLKYFVKPEEGSALIPKRTALEVPIDVVNSSLISNTISELRLFKKEILEQYYLPKHFIEAYYGRRIQPYLMKNQYADKEEDGFVYRGMQRTLDDLIGIIESGMKLSRVKWINGGGGLSFSSHIQEAISYIFQNQNKRGASVGVVFKMKLTDSYELLNDDILSPANTVFKLHRDLKPEEIVDVYLFGEYGLESISSIISKIKNGRGKPHSDWTNQFGLAE